MGSVSDCDQVLGIQDVWIPSSDLSSSHWVHVMNPDVCENFVAFDAEIATEIARDDIPASVLPLCRAIEVLVQPALMTERDLADSTAKSEIVVSLFVGVQPNELGVTPNQGDSQAPAAEPAPRMRAWR